MGKWTSQYCDDVLASKIKSLVSGSIRRAKLEDRVGHTISYDDFVQELDAGDAFTTSLVDVLVQEVATRRARSSVEEKRLISDATSRGLRMLAAPSRVYRPRPTRVGPPPSAIRRSINLNMSDYLSTLPPEDLNVDEDGDSTDSALDPAGAAEGARLNSEIWDAMATGPSSSSGPSILRGSIRRARADLPYPPPPQPATALNHGLRALVESDLPSLTTHVPSSHPRIISRATRLTVRSADSSAARRRTGLIRSDEHEHEHEEPAPAATTVRRGFPYSRRYEGWSTDAPGEYSAWGTSSLPSVDSPTDETAPPPPDEPVWPVAGVDSRSFNRRDADLLAGSTLPWHTA